MLVFSPSLESRGITTYALLGLCCLWGALARAAEHDDQNEDELAAVREGLLSSFDLPLGDLLKPPAHKGWAELFEGWSGGLNADFLPPLPESANKDRRPVLQGNLRYVPLSHWFIQSTAFYFLKAEDQASWEPDFTYSFGYNDWRPYTLHLSYENYGQNRLRPNRAQGERLTRYQEGQYRLGWKFPLPDELAEPLLIETQQRIDCEFDYNLSPRYASGPAHVYTGRHKRSWSLACRYPIYKQWYFNIKFYYYPFGEQQQNWDPDYSYEIGYFDWRQGTFSLQYKNYSGNRYPWRDDAAATGGLQNGSFMFSWAWPW